MRENGQQKLRSRGWSHARSLPHLQIQFSFTEGYVKKKEARSLLRRKRDIQRQRQCPPALNVEPPTTAFVLRWFIKNYSHNTRLVRNRHHSPSPACSRREHRTQ